MSNIQIVSSWAQESDAEVSALAQAIIEVGRAKPRKRKRLSYICQNHPELWQRMMLAGLVDDLWYDASASEVMAVSGN